MWALHGSQKCLIQPQLSMAAHSVRKLLFKWGFSKTKNSCQEMSDPASAFHGCTFCQEKPVLLKALQSQKCLSGNVWSSLSFPWLKFLSGKACSTGASPKPKVPLRRTCFSMCSSWPLTGSSMGLFFLTFNWFWSFTGFLCVPVWISALPFSSPKAAEKLFLSKAASSPWCLQKNLLQFLRHLNLSSSGCCAHSAAPHSFFPSLPVQHVPFVRCLQRGTVSCTDWPAMLGVR